MQRFTGSMINISNVYQHVRLKKTDFFVSWASISDKRTVIGEECGFPRSRVPAVKVAPYNSTGFNFENVSYRFKIDQRHGKKKGVEWKALGTIDLNRFVRLSAKNYLTFRRKRERSSGGIVTQIFLFFFNTIDLINILIIAINYI